MTKQKKVLLTVISLLLGSCCILVFIGSLLPDDETTTLGEIVRGETDTPEPTPAPLSSEDQFQAEVIRVLGSGNRDVERVEFVNIDPETVTIRFAINDNLTTNMIKRGLMMDIAKLMEAASKSGLSYDELFLVGTFSMVDQYGNAEEKVVSTFGIVQDEVDKINWDNFLTDNVDRLGNWWLHPAFEE